MYTIQLKKFGTVLVSRPAGSEAFNAIRPQLSPDLSVQIDFDGVLTVTPSWLDEFLTHLTTYNGGKVELLPTKNASVWRLCLFWERRGRIWSQILFCVLWSGCGLWILK